MADEPRLLVLLRRLEEQVVGRHLGPEVNLGNIPHDEVIPLETLRLGLRSDTMPHLLLKDIPTAT
jgi:phosphosulfolactate synthase (CoM biosynthesis protein A)